MHDIWSCDFVWVCLMILYILVYDFVRVKCPGWFQFMILSTYLYHIMAKKGEQYDTKGVGTGNIVERENL